MSTDTLAPAKKIRLRRMRPIPAIQEPQEDLIQKNLVPLVQHTEKKKRAQEAYYENNLNTIGASPMTRVFRKPVRQRLGRRVPFNGTNASMLPPKKRLYKVRSTQNNPINNRKVHRKNIAQLRLDKIREKNRLTQNLNSPAKRIKLRRIIPTNNNLRVQVANNDALLTSNDMIHVNVARHRQILNPHLQRDIRKLQIGRQTEEVLPNVRVMVTSTNLSTTERFGMLN